MSSSFVLGNLLGHALLSFALVWLTCLLTSRLDWRFDGTSQGQKLDVMMFVGQAPGKFPVVLNIYTMRGKMGSLSEHRCHAWTRISYL